CTSTATHELASGGLAGRPPDRLLARNAAPHHLCGAAGGRLGWSGPRGDAACGALARVGPAENAWGEARKQFTSSRAPLSTRLAACAHAALAAVGSVCTHPWRQHPGPAKQSQRRRSADEPCTERAGMMSNRPCSTLI